MTLSRQRGQQNTTVDKTGRHSDSQVEGLVPLGVEVGANGLGLLLGLVLGVRDELELDVGVGQPVGVHGNQVPAFTH